MPPHSSMCLICGERVAWDSDLCWFCDELRRLGRGPAPLAPPRAEPAWKLPGQTMVECHPSDAEQMSAAGYTLLRSKIDPDTRIIISQVWVKVPDDGRSSQ